MKKRMRSKTGWLITGSAAALVMCVGLTALFSKMLLTQRIGEKYVEWLIPAVLLISSLLGNILSHRMCGELVPAVPATTISMIVIMLIIGFMMEGPFVNVSMRIGPVLIGGALSCVICLKKTGMRGKRKKRYC